MIAASALHQDVSYLTETIGVRLAGSEQERRAAEYWQSRFLEYVPKCTIETFPTTCCMVEYEKLMVLRNGK